MSALESLSQRSATVAELFRFLWKRRLWWMIPLVLLVLAVSGMLFIATQSPVSPFIYTLF